MLSMIPDSNINNTSKIMMENLFGNQFQITAFLITIMIVLVTIIAIISVKNYLFRDKTNKNKNKINKNKNKNTKKQNINTNMNNNTTPITPKENIKHTQQKPQIPSPSSNSPTSPIPIEGSTETQQQQQSQSNKKVMTIVKRTRTTTIIEQNGKEPKTVTQTKTEAIDIPQELIHKVLTTKEFWSIFVQGLRFAVMEEQGRRTHMENSTNIWDMGHNDHCKEHKQMSFCVFDGHNGDAAAKFCTKYLPQFVSQFIQAIDNNTNNTANKPDRNDEKHDDKDDDEDEIWQNDEDDDIAAAIRKAFHKTDREFERQALQNHSEAGAVGVYVYYHYDKDSKSNYMYVANVGDCRAIICSDGKVEQLTIDHNTKNQSERVRCGIKDNSELLSNEIGVTRAIGDYSPKYVTEEGNNNNANDANYTHQKLDGLSCDPYITKHKLDDKDEFVILGCDGLFEVVPNELAKSECRRSLRRYGDCTKAAQKLIEVAKGKSNQYNFGVNVDESEKQTSDNISVMVIGFANKSDDGSEHIGPKSQLIQRRPGSRWGRSRLRARHKLNNNTNNDK